MEVDEEVPCQRDNNAHNGDNYVEEADEMAQPTPKTYSCDEHAAQFLLRLREVHHTSEAAAVEKHPDLVTIYGIKGQSPLNELQFFHVVEGLPSDIAHDIFEGVVKDVLENVIGELVSQGIITYKTVCEKLQTFLYCDVDKPKKPITPSSGFLHVMEAFKAMTQFILQLIDCCKYDAVVAAVLEEYPHLLEGLDKGNAKFDDNERYLYNGGQHFDDDDYRFDDEDVLLDDGSLQPSDKVTKNGDVDLD
ncbi:hypothetical protein HOLleu_43791 [Holothuria leucospilota]|uniref:Uncharacterized protein n=1 Tax=Holothuria leucospilota TaxID=206669 RepID=A0A9Q0YAC3_HOLLE|nr:hypothetical protein HOLleu_43791 [Holothuria leucospilota]